LVHIELPKESGVSMKFKFDAGQAVEYRPMGGTIGLYSVVRQMPEEDGALDRAYRIKSEGESFERTVLECDLSATDRPASMYGVAAPLRRNTDGHR
jgi:hypothetical protein